MLEFGQTITDIAGIAKLVRDRRHRRPWEKFLATAASARASTEAGEAKASRLAEVAEFGSNPGNLKMLSYLPDGLPDAAPLVVVLHGCTQTAATYDRGTEWSVLADRYGFAVVFPQQKPGNNPLRCFNWFKAEDTARDSGEALSIRQMIERIVTDHGLDRGQIYVTGLSAGAAMTSVMLATYPDVFTGGAIIAGVPYRCANGLQDGFEVIFQGRSRPANEWGDLVRAASPHRGPWPKISVWHGDADTTVKPINAEEILKQWSNVHGVAEIPTIETTVDGHAYRVWRGPSAEDVLESYTISGMAHGAPIDPNGLEPYGSSAPFFIDAGISSTYRIAKSWGLTDRTPLKARPRTAEQPIEKPQPSVQSAKEGRPVHGSREIAKDTIIVDRLGRVDAGGASSTHGNASGSGKKASGRADKRAEGGAPGGIDVQKIISKSLELAQMAQNASRSTSGGATPGGVDIKGILSRSFELAGLAMSAQSPSDAPDDTAEEATDGLRGSGWEGEGWRLLPPDVKAPKHGPILTGAVTSGVAGVVGSQVLSVSRTLSLGSHPRLNYVRKLDLRAAANMATTSQFTVYVDDVAIDEVSVVGMDYSEADWTAREGIDLSAFAGRTVQLRVEISANANVFKEVSARAWVAGVAIENAAVREDA